MFARFLLLFVFLLPATPALAQSFTPEEAAKADAIVADVLGKTGVPSASVAVVRHGKLAFAKAYGKQSPDIPVARADTIYQIASISKQFVAAGILLLEDRGKLSLDDKVSRYIPGITGGDRITIRQLLSHTSGLQDYWPQDYSFADMAKPVTPQQIVDRWAKKPLDYEPGTQRQYSNTGYVVAGLILEKASGQPLLDFLNANIFKPLGIKAINQDLAVGKGFPIGYGRNALGPVRAVTPPAPGWLFSTAELAMSAPDLARWDIARINRELLPADDWAEQEKNIKLTDGSSTGYGLGVYVGKRDGRNYIEHSGEAVGFLSQNTVFPETGDAIVVLVNAWFGDAQYQIARKLENLLYPPALQTEAEADAALMRRIYDQLRTGSLDRSLLTANANYYFTDTVLKDFQDSLAPLGDPQSFAADGPSRLRGGFVLRNYTLSFPKLKLSLNAFREPGENGKIEQYLITPLAE